MSRRMGGFEVERYGKKMKMYPAGYLDGHVEGHTRETLEKQVAAAKVSVNETRKK